jgi:hypothetical protein
MRAHSTRRGLAALFMALAASMVSGCVAGPSDGTTQAYQSLTVSFQLYAVTAGDTLTLTCSQTSNGSNPVVFAHATAVTSSSIQFQGIPIYAASVQVVVPSQCWSQTPEVLAWVQGGKVGPTPPAYNTYISGTEQGATLYELNGACQNREVPENLSAQQIVNDCQLKDASGNRRGLRLLAWL